MWHTLVELHQDASLNDWANYINDRPQHTFGTFILCVYVSIGINLKKLFEYKNMLNSFSCFLYHHFPILDLLEMENKITGNLSGQINITTFEDFTHTNS